MVIKLSKEYTLYPEEVLEQFSYDYATAVKVKYKKRSKRRKLFGLICDPRFPARIADIKKFKKIGVSNVMTPIEWFTHKTPFYPAESVVLVFEEPAISKPLFAGLDDQITSVKDIWIIDNLIIPILRTLSKLDAANLTHRAIMPTNIFGDITKNAPVVLGQCFNLPPGCMQGTAFELRHYAMAERFGRGSGSWQNDVFALGVTALSLYLGKVSGSGMSEDDFLSKRMDLSSLYLYIESNKIPDRLMVLLRGMLQDNGESMMSIDELLDWIFKQKVSSHATKNTRFNIAIRYKQVDHYSLPALAHMLSDNWNDARIILGSDRVMVWASRSLLQNKVPKGLLDRMKQLNDIDPHSPIMEQAISKIMILMDPNAPIRLQEYKVCSDALIVYSSIYQEKHESMQRLVQILRDDLLAFWVDSQYGSGQEVQLFNIFSFQSALIRSDAADPAELLFYDYYTDLPCKSPILSDYYVLYADKLLLSLEAIVEGLQYNQDTYILDDHIYAFLKARSADIHVSLPWQEIYGSVGKLRHIAGIKALANLQMYYQIAKLPNLFEYTRSLLLAISADIKLTVRRERLTKQLQSIRNNGQLNSLLLLWRGGVLYKQDNQEFEIALQHYYGYIMREKSLVSIFDSLQSNSLRTARIASALVGSVVGLGGLLIILVMAL